MTEIIFKDLEIRSIDISVFNAGDIDWKKLASFNINAVYIRTSFGRVTDGDFVENWTGAKGVIRRRAYHYLDYYSHIPLEISDEEWGKLQAQKVWALIKNDNDGSIVWLDIEKASMAPSIESVLSRVITISVAFFAEMDRLNGKLNGAYLNAGLVKLFAKALGKRPLWVAWYNEDQTPSAVINYCRNAGWYGPIWEWQYASDGDTGSDSIGDGIVMGLKVPALDLNMWIGTKAEFEASFSNLPLPPTPDPSSGVTKVKTVPVGLTLVNNQNTRYGPGIGYNMSPIKLNAGNEIEMLEIKGNSNGDTWVRVGPGLWAAQKVDNKLYIKPILL